MRNAIRPCLWFNNCAQEAVDFYLSVFKTGKILHVDYYTEVGEEVTKHKKGDVVTIEFQLLGTSFIALNAGPEFSFSPSVSFTIDCDTQEEIDYYWDKLSAQPEAEQCGWLVDKFGVSWQVVPTVLYEMMKSGTALQRRNVTMVYMDMKKFDIEQLGLAYREVGDLTQGVPSHLPNQDKNDMD